jgi:hypothetical protein
VIYGIFGIFRICIRTRVGAGRGVVGERFMGPMDSALQFRKGFLVASRVAFQPEKEGLPVDAKDDLECQEWVFERKEQEVPIGEGDHDPGENTYELSLLTPVVIDEDLKALSWELKAELKLQIEVGEGGDIEVLHHATQEGPVWLERYQIWFPFPEGIPNLDHRG